MVLPLVVPVFNGRSLILVHSRNTGKLERGRGDVGAIIRGFRIRTSSRQALLSGECRKIRDRGPCWPNLLPPSLPPIIPREELHGLRLHLNVIRRVIRVLLVALPVLSNRISDLRGRGSPIHRLVPRAARLFRWIARPKETHLMRYPGYGWREHQLLGGFHRFRRRDHARCRRHVRQDSALGSPHFHLGAQFFESSWNRRIELKNREFEECMMEGRGIFYSIIFSLGILTWIGLKILIN